MKISTISCSTLCKIFPNHAVHTIDKPYLQYNHIAIIIAFGKIKYIRPRFVNAVEGCPMDTSGLPNSIFRQTDRYKFELAN